MFPRTWILAGGLLFIPCVISAWGAEADLSAQLRSLRAVGPKGGGHRHAVAAAQAASKADPSQLTAILSAMDGANPIATNWIRGVAEAVAQRAANGKTLPLRDLEAFLTDTSHSPRGRRLAYELIAAVDETAESRLIPALIDDPSLELRRDAVALALSKAAQTDSTDAQLKAYEKVFRSCRDHDQIKQAAAKIKELGGRANLPAHYGFVMSWKILGPFDNVQDKGWNLAYPPEERVDLQAKYDGQKGEIGWIETTTSDDLGAVDLNKVLSNHKGAIAYAYSEFISDQDQEVDLRLGSMNANKVWLNGELLTANHVYHANTSIDQYLARGKLQKGKNAILLKIAQNEQTEPWAQDWKFQLRVCDAIGTAVLSQDRDSAAAASLSRTVR